MARLARGATLGGRGAGLLVHRESRFTPSMHQWIDLDRLRHRALRGLHESINSQPPLPVPAACPVTLDELLAED
jgi:hypothetical protein